MPLVGWRCDASPSVQVTFEECLDCARSGSNPCNNTPEMLLALGEGGNRGTEIHVTNLNGCLRQTALQLTEPYWSKPSEYYLVLMGRILHAGMERWRDAGTVAEERFAREIDGLRIVGTPDAIYPELRLIRDWKKPKSLPTRGPKSYHEMQLNTYRWLVAPKHEIDHLEVVYFGNTENRRLPVRVWSLDETEAWLHGRARVLAPSVHRDTLAQGEPPLPPADGGVAPAFCQLCPVRQACADKMREGK